MASLLMDTSISSKSESKPKSRPEHPKLRASCDGCYLSKVKCSKEIPTCTRCLDHGIVCNYSPSQRIGKPKRVPAETRGNDPASPIYDSDWRRRSIALSIGDASTHGASLIDWNLDHSALAVRSANDFDHDANFQATWPQSLSDGSVGNGSWPDETSHRSSYASSCQPSSSASTVFDFEGNNGMPATPVSVESGSWLQSPRNYLTHKKEPSAERLSHSITASFSFDELGFQNSSPGLPCPAQNVNCTCPMQTFEVLRTLHERSSNPWTPFDTILSVNKDINSRINATLSCPCRHDATTVMTLAASIAKILAWYRSIFFPPLDQICPSKRQGTTQSAPTPISLGAFRLDSADEKAVKIQVALSELKKIDALVARIPLMETGGGDQLGAARVYGDVTAFLRRRLREIGEELQREVERDFGEEV